MPKLDSKKQIKKLNFLAELANSKRNGDLTSKLAAFTIFNGFIDFYSIQAARLIEQIILKAQLAENKPLVFSPHEDEWFYDNRVSTRRILKEIKKLLPFHDRKNPEKDREINERTDNLLQLVNKFLDYRNAVIHRLGNPNTSLDDLINCCDRALDYYDKVRVAHREMVEILRPYRFSEKEIDYFYKDAK